MTAAAGEFSGFAVVTNTMPLCATTVTYFHTGGGQKLFDFGRITRTPATSAKRSMAYRVETYGNDNNLYKFVVNQVDQNQLQ